MSFSKIAQTCSCHEGDSWAYNRSRINRHTTIFHAINEFRRARRYCSCGQSPFTRYTTSERLILIALIYLEILICNYRTNPLWISVPVENLKRAHFSNTELNYKNTQCI